MEINKLSKKIELKITNKQNAIKALSHYSAHWSEL